MSNTPKSASRKPRVQPATPRAKPQPALEGQGDVSSREFTWDSQTVWPQRDLAVAAEERARRALKTHVVGQKETSDLLLTLGLQHLMSAPSPKEGMISASCRNALLIGPAGTGKTHLPHIICEHLGIPLAIVDAAGFGPPGSRYRRSLDEVFGEVLRAANGQIKRAERGALLIENLDQLIESISMPGVSELQQSWTRLLAGYARSVATEQGTSPLASNGWWIIGAGTFEGLQRVVNRRALGPELGFQPKAAKFSNERFISPLDVVSLGLQPGLVARLPFLCDLQPFTEAELVALGKLDNSVVSQWVQEFRHAGVALEFSEAARQELAREAMKLNLGARGLPAILASRLGRLMADLPQLRTFAQRVLVTEDLIRGAEAVQIVEGPSLFPIGDSLDLSTEDDTILPPDLQNLFPPGSIPKRPARSSHSAEASGRLASSKEIDLISESSDESGASSPASAPGGLRIDGFCPLAEVTRNGTTLRPFPNRTLLYPEPLEMVHTLVTGKSGSGKTTRVIERMIEAALRDSERTVIVIDPGKSLQATVHGLAGVLRPANSVLHFDWLDPDHCVRWNMLAATQDRASASRLARIVANMTPLITNETRYFHQRAERLLTHVMMAQHECYGGVTLRSIRELVEQGEVGLALLAEQSESRVLREFGKQMSQSQNPNTTTTFTELESWFSFAEDDRIVETTSNGAFDPRCLAEEPRVVYVGVAEESIEQTKTVLNLFLRTTLDALIQCGTHNGGPLKRPVSIIVDECPRLGRVLGLEAMANSLRKRRVGLTFALQTSEQLAAVYQDGAASFLAAFNNHIFVPPVAEADAQRASDASGMMEVVHATTEADGVTPTSFYPQMRPVLTNHEVAYPTAHAELGPLITFKLKDYRMFQGYLRASWQSDFVRQAKEQWQPERLPKIESIPSEADLVREVLLPNFRAMEASVSPMDVVGKIGDLIATNIGHWSATQIAELWKQLDHDIPVVIHDHLNRISHERLEAALESLKHEVLAWDETKGSPRKWWTATEESNQGLVNTVRLALELARRDATITDYFMAWIYAHTEHGDVSLAYLDYQRTQNRRLLEEKLTTQTEED